MRARSCRCSERPPIPPRRSAFTALGSIGDARALPALTRALADDVEEVRLCAAAALGRLGQRDALRGLKAALEHAEPRLGQAILAALASIDDDGARSLLIAQLQAPGLHEAATRSLMQQARKLMRDPEPSGKSPHPGGIGAMIAELAASLGTAGDDRSKLAVAQTLAQIAAVAPIEGALPALLSRAASENAELAAGSMDALAASALPDALMPLLERLGQSEGAALERVLHALRTYFERAEPDGRAADPLLARLAQVNAPQRLAIVELLGRVGAPRAVPALSPLLGQTDVALRLATVRALAAIGASEAAPALVPLLDASDARTRFETARALRTTASTDVVQTLLERLSAERSGDRHALLIALGGALARLSSLGKLPEPLSRAALQALTSVAAGDDDELSDRAVDALAVWAPPGALAPLASGLRLPSSRRRATAVRALGQLGDPEARQVLRYVLQHGSTREAATAAAALGEVGDQRDVAALVKATKRRHWPVPGAAAYALSRLAERGVLKPHSAARELCELGHSREPYVRANVAAALSVLGAAPCDESGPDPLRWLDPTHTAIVRAAAARWTYAAALAGRVDTGRANEALARCVATDIEADVRAVCASPALSRQSEGADVYAYASDGVSLLRNALVALRLASGAVFLGYTDHNGQLRLKAAPRGELLLEDPGLAPLEPPD
jgi:HEAT repeat protein